MSAESSNFATARDHGLQGCHTCTALAQAADSHCRNCGEALHPHWEHNLQATWAWLITSVVLYIPANTLPIMYTQQLGKRSANTILGGVVTLWEHGSYPIALVIFVASVLVPLGKMLILFWLCISVHIRSTLVISQKARLYRITEFVGRWSMVDVFVVGILVALIQLGSIMSVSPGFAAVAFAAMVVATMLAAITFDPRLLWSESNTESQA